MEDIIVCVSSPPDFNLDLFSLWIEGKSQDESHKILSKKIGNNRAELKFERETQNIQLDHSELLKYDVIDQYRSFQVLEHFVSQPTLLRNQSLCIVAVELQPLVIERYWSLDDGFAREVLNKRLTKGRRDLEDIAETCGLNLRRVTRQFENIKRIYNAYDEFCPNDWMNIFSFVSTHFLLNNELCRKYSCIIFLLISKFTLTAKRRLLRTSCDCLESCAALIVAFLCSDTVTFFKILNQDRTASDIEILSNMAFVADKVSVDSGMQEDMTLLESNATCWSFVWRAFSVLDSCDIDKQLLSTLRDIRNLLTGDLLDGVCQSLASKLGPGLVKKIEGNSTFHASRIRTIMKSILQIGANLSQSREYRDLFEDVLIKVAEPLEEAKLTREEMNVFMLCCIYGVNDLIIVSGPSGSARRTSLSSDGVTVSVREDLGGSNATSVRESFSSHPSGDRYRADRADSSHSQGNNQSFHLQSSSPMQSFQFQTNISNHSSMNLGHTPGGRSHSASNVTTDSGYAPSVAGGDNTLRAIHMKRDWMRFISFIRLFLLQLTTR
jgi:hypothetical protein